MDLAASLGLASTFAALGAAGFAGYRAAKVQYDRTLGSRDHWRAQLEPLRIGVTQESSTADLEFLASGTF